MDFRRTPLAVLLQQMIEGLNGQRCQYGLMLSTARGSQHASSLISCLEKRCCACSIENARLRLVRERRLHVIGALLRSQHSCYHVKQTTAWSSSTGDREGEATCSVDGNIVGSWPHWLRYQSLRMLRPAKCNCLTSGPSRLHRPYWTNIWTL